MVKEARAGESAARGMKKREGVGRGEGWERVVILKCKACDCEACAYGEDLFGHWHSQSCIANAWLF